LTAEWQKILRSRGRLGIFFDSLCSHDFVPRYMTSVCEPFQALGADASLLPPGVAPPACLASHAHVLRANFRPLYSRLLYWCFCASSFTYSLVGTLMLITFNRRLPAVYVTSVPLPIDLFSVLLVFQGPVSYAADVWARTKLCAPQHWTYLADRLLATSMTILTLYIGNICWAPHSSDFQQSLALLCPLGLVPFGISQKALNEERFATFMAYHIAWHISIPLIAIVWLVHTASGL